MADFGSTKYNVSFEEWHELLMDYAELRGGSAADAEAWRDDYEAGKTPVEAYCDEWGDEWARLIIRKGMKRQGKQKQWHGDIATWKKRRYGLSGEVVVWWLEICTEKRGL